jgi:gas vesicle protein
MNKLISFLGGALLGAAASAATILLMTPRKGEDVRSDIKHEVDMILEEGRKAARARRAELEAQLDQMRGDTSAGKIQQ